MKIVQAPHPSLRKKAQPITKVDKKVKKFLKELETTLENKKNPRGVGLAAPQVDTNWRAFVIDQAPSQDQPQQLQLFINPIISKTSKKQTLGQDTKYPTLEGCLSIPGFYGPVPRWEWIEVEYDQIKNDELKRTRQKLDWFTARVFQHELNHLEGILFTDFSLDYELPLYREDKKTGKLKEIDDYSLIELF